MSDSSNFDFETKTQVKALLKKEKQVATFNLLVVEDDDLIAQALKLSFPKSWKLIWIQNYLDLNPKIVVHAAFIDMHLRGNTNHAEGLEVIQALKKHHPTLPVLAMSGDLSLDLMEKGLNSGAFKFLAKPIMQEEFVATLEKIESLWQMRTRETRGGKAPFWIGSSAVSENVKKEIANLRGEEGPILIFGETGTGKEVAARLLNDQETAKPLLSINLAGIPENLFESEMYGHVKGAFTGADSSKIGLVEAADGGDLFLDEIEALSLANQAKLLRFLETGEFRRIGGKENQRSSARVLVATNKDLRLMVAAKEFREDLMFRLSGKVIRLPALRERPSEIAELAENFLKPGARRSFKQLSPEALDVFKNYSWPGNVRELKRICEQLLISAPLPVIRREDAVKFLQNSEPTLLEGSEQGIGLSEIMENYEKKILITMLEKYQSDIEKTCEALKVSRSNLYKKIKDYNIEM